MPNFGNENDCGIVNGFKYAKEALKDLPKFVRFKIWVMNKLMGRKSDGFVKLSPNDGKSLDISATLVYSEKIIGNLFKHNATISGAQGGCQAEIGVACSMGSAFVAYMENLNRNYFSQGLTTPETIGPKYAASTTWATQVNAYINSVKAA